MSEYEQAISTRANTMNSSGILLPALSSHWLLDIPSLGERNLLKVQAVKCELSLIKKQLICHIEQSILGDEYNEINDLTTKKATVRIIAIDGNTNPVHTVEMSFSKLIDHVITYDYSQHGALVHRLTFEFKNVLVRPPS